MEVTGTREAFAALIEERGIYKKLGVERSTVSTWKIYLREGKSISLDKMEEMLIKAGASVAQEKVWKMPVIENVIHKTDKDFNLALRYMRPGKSISIDLTDIPSPDKIDNWVIKYARDQGCSFSKDDSALPIVTYSYVDRETAGK